MEKFIRQRVVARTMPEPMNMPDLVTNLYVKDVAKSVAFYTKAMGFKRGQLWKSQDGKTHVFAEIRVGDRSFGIVSAKAVPNDAAYLRDHKKGPLGRGVVLGVNTKSVDRAYASLKGKKGVKILSKPEDTPWGMRVMDVRDANGYTWSYTEQTE